MRSKLGLVIGPTAYSIFWLGLTPLSGKKNLWVFTFDRTAPHWPWQNIVINSGKFDKLTKYWSTDISLLNIVLPKHDILIHGNNRNKVSYYLLEYPKSKLVVSLINSLSQVMNGTTKFWESLFLQHKCLNLPFFIEKKDGI